MFEQAITDIIAQADRLSKAGHLVCDDTLSSKDAFLLAQQVWQQTAALENQRALFADHGSVLAAGPGKHTARQKSSN